jgi:hypothetical protein
MSEPIPVITEEFCKVMKDFTTDILTTFPEHSGTIDPGLVDILDGKNDTDAVKTLFNYIKELYPERFFDFLYQNEDIFTNADIDTHFLPGVEFKDLWTPEITDSTKLVIWKYLQLILFSVINGDNDGKSFGDTAKLFEAINEKELRSKLKETMEQMSDIFDMSGDSPATDLPNPEDLHSHINGMLQGNLGKLAAEITEETMKDLDMDVSGAESVGDVFQTLFKNPGKLMGLIQKVGSKLDSKLKSGELNESEIMQEAMDLMEQMETMPGMANMQDMLKKMGMPGMSKGKMDINAMKGKLNQNMKGAKQKERMLRTLAKRKSERQETQIQILQKQLAAAKVANAIPGVEGTVKKKKKKKKKNRKNKK